MVTSVTLAVTKTDVATGFVSQYSTKMNVMNFPNVRSSIHSGKLYSPIEIKVLRELG